MVICVPQVHLLTLVAHGIFRNGICNDQLLQVNSVFIFKLKTGIKHRYSNQSLVQLMHVSVFGVLFGKYEHKVEICKCRNFSGVCECHNIQWEQGCPGEKILTSRYVTKRELISSAQSSQCYFFNTVIITLTFSFWFLLYVIWELHYSENSLAALGNCLL